MPKSAQSKVERSTASSSVESKSIDKEMPSTEEPIVNGKTPDGILDELAEELAYNYFSNSFGDDYNMGLANCDEVFKKDNTEQVKRFKDRIERNERVRNIMIIGAGVSSDAYKCIPAGFWLIEEMKANYETEIKTIDFLRDKFNAAEDEIKDITGNPELTFENYLYLLSKFFVLQKDLRDKINSMTSIRYSVSLFNEIVAHMLKHSFIDIVVNFNFEETLDLVIEEEIGKDNYHNIISDGNCVGLEEILVDGRLKMPIYIKPHGTYSHKSTLRFTNRHYFDLPNDISKMLKDLVSGKRGLNGTGKPIQRINLIIVGFAIGSIEFNKILNSNLPPHSRIFHLDMNTFANGEDFLEKRPIFKKTFLPAAISVNRDANDLYWPVSTAKYPQNVLQPQLKKTESENAEQTDETPKIKAQKNKEKIINRITPTFGEMISVIWRKQNRFFSEAYKPRSIARHEITSYLFYLPKYGLNSYRTHDITLDERVAERKFVMEVEGNPKYFRNRVLVELFILLNRNNGILDIAEILKGRVGEYYQRYRKAYETNRHKIKELNSLHELLNEFVKDKAASEQHLLNVPEYTTGKNIFILQHEFDMRDFDNWTDLKKALTQKVNEITKVFESLRIPEIYPDLKHQRQIRDFKRDFYHIVKLCYDKALKPPGSKGRNAANEILKLNRALTVLYRLLMSKKISTFFKFNFVLNYDKSIVNGKKINEGEDLLCFGKRTVLSELLRLLTKSWNNHYFIIDPAPSNPVHHIWESFSKRKLIHTNLGRSAEFGNLFKKDWNVLLTITETGSLLNFLQNISEESEQKEMQRLLRNRYFIVICSYESIRELYPQKTKRELLSLHKMHLCVDLGDKRREGERYLVPLKNMTVLVVPYNHHNHHMSVFLHSLPENNSLLHTITTKFTCISKEKTDNTLNNGDATKAILLKEDEQTILAKGELSSQLKQQYDYFFMVLGSIYKFRYGFSNSIDPLYIGLAEKETTNNYVYRDQVKLIDTFVIHLLRSFQFELFSINDKGTKNPEGSATATGDNDESENRQLFDKFEFLERLYDEAAKRYQTTNNHNTFGKDRDNINQECFLKALFEFINKQPQ